jgi:hypothetical protein
LTLVGTAATQATDLQRLTFTKASILSSHTGELVIALCGPIGSPLHRVASTLKSQLVDDFAYESCEIIRLSGLIEKYGKKAPDQPRYDHIKALIDTGDELREKYGSGILAELAVNQIAIERNKAKTASGQDRFLASSGVPHYRFYQKSGRA